jgi:serine/threonine protein kinase
MRPESFGPDLVLVKRLAAGGMAEVFRARQTGAGGFEKAVAVKRILPNFAADPAFKTMFREELALTARFQHPNIVQVFSSGEHQGYLFLVMEFVDGRTLAQLLEAMSDRRRAVSPEVVAYVASEAAKGLDYAHRFADASGRPLGVIHRDVSPQNIMVSYTGHVKVVDFGIAKAADRAELTAPGRIKGKVAYMSPEQVGGQKLDGRTDIFSLGIVLWEMATGLRLFKAENEVATMNRIAKHEVVPPSSFRNDLDPELDRITMKALAHKRADRYASAMDLARDLKTFLAEKYPRFMEPDLGAFMTSTFGAEIGKDMEEARALSADLPTVTPESRVALSTPTPTYASSARRPLSIPPTAGVPVSGTAVRPWMAAPLLLAAAVAGFLATRRGEPEARLPSGTGGLVAWFDASSLPYPEGEPIAEWSDASPYRLSASQADPTMQPKLTRVTAKGQPAVIFGGGQFLTSDALATHLRNADGLTAIFVARIDPRPDKHYLFSIQGADQQRDSFRVGFASEGRFRVKASPTPGPPYIDSELGVVRGEWAIYSVSAGLESVAVYIDGVERLSASIQPAVNFYDATFFSIGQDWDRGGPSDFLVGDLAELVVYGRRLDGDERRGLELGFAAKYGIDLGE